MIRMPTVLNITISDYIYMDGPFNLQVGSFRELLAI